MKPLPQDNGQGQPALVLTCRRTRPHVVDGAAEESGWVKKGKDAFLGYSAVDPEDGYVEHVEVQPQKWVWTLMATSAPRAYERVYDTHGRLVRHPLGTLVRDITYDDADRVSRFTHYSAYTAQPAPNVDQSFGYDDLSRLISVTGATNWSYAYDANGNRTASSTGITARGYTVSATSNRLDALTNPARSMGYDVTGNTLTDVQSGSSANYTARYSLEGRLAAMTQGTAAGVDFAYDAMGRRITRSAWTGSPTNPRTVTLYAYDQDHHLIGEYKADGSPLMEYIWLGDTPVAMIKLSGAEATTYAIHTDHLNTPRVVLDQQAQVRWRWLGEPFGSSPAEEQPNTSLPALQQSLRFPGQQYEPFGGRHYNHFRDYDPTTGRYVQSDPIGLQGGINTYSYVHGNPLSYIDPEGLLAGALPYLLPPIIVGCAISPACRNWLKDQLQPNRQDPMRYDPGYKPGHWPPPPIDPPKDKPDSWPKDDKNFCIRTYALCQDFDWTGNCQTCLDRCLASASGNWPFQGPQSCRPRNKKRGDMCEAN